MMSPSLRSPRKASGLSYARPGPKKRRLWEKKDWPTQVEIRRIRPKKLKFRRGPWREFWEDEV